MWTRAHFFYFLAAAGLFLVLHLYFVQAWDGTYALHPWTGYAPGVAPPFFTSSPWSQLVASVVLLVMALALTLIPSGGQRLIGIAMWAGVMAACVVIWVATAKLRNDSNMWPISLVFLAVMTGVPMLIGRALGLLYWRIRGRRKPAA
jgi:hypothetical protein